MVEKWLVEVEESMLSNVRKVISDSVKDYANTPRRKWVISWPGQVVICCSSIYWTSEVTQAMTTPEGMDVSLIYTHMSVLASRGSVFYCVSISI